MLSLWKSRRRVRPVHRYQPALGALDDRVLMTQLGMAPPWPGGRVQVQNQHGAASVAGLPIRLLAGTWQVHTFYSAYGARLLHIPSDRTEIDGRDVNTIQDGVLTSVEQRPGAAVAQWSIRALPRKQLLLTAETNFSQAKSLTGKQTGPCTWTFQGTVPFPSGELAVRAAFVIENRNFYAFSLSLPNPDGKWQEIYCSFNQRVTPGA